MCGRLRWGLVAKGTSFNLGEDYTLSTTISLLQIKNASTSQSVDGPLLELLELDFGDGGGFVEIQSVGIGLLLVLGNSELLFFMIVNVPSLGLKSLSIRSNHRL